MAVDAVCLACGEEHSYSARRGARLAHQRCHGCGGNRLAQSRSKAALARLAQTRDSVPSIDECMVLGGMGLERLTDALKGESEPPHTREDTLAVLGLLALASDKTPSLPERLNEAARELMQRERP